jgi:hypothetical protein
MKLQHLASAPTRDDELVRLFDFGSEESNLLVASITQWLRDTSTPLELAELPFISAVNCSLSLVVVTQDEGIHEVSPGAYDCRLTLDSFGQMLELMGPFRRDGTTGFQWLYDLDTPIEFLFSPNGSW